MADYFNVQKNPKVGLNYTLHDNLMKLSLIKLTDLYNGVMGNLHTKYAEGESFWPKYEELTESVKYFDEMLRRCCWKKNDDTNLLKNYAGVFEKGLVELKRMREEFEDLENMEKNPDAVQRTINRMNKKLSQKGNYGAVFTIILLSMCCLKLSAVHPFTGDFFGNHYANMVRSALGISG